ncbi:MAG: sorbosone dehydrogenase family protein [Rhodothermales bacterium]|nr:sorbosone dehydrogenase family protein [Rhodothermales bacterium]
MRCFNHLPGRPSVWPVFGNHANDCRCSVEDGPAFADSSLANIELPDGFRIALYADGIPNARMLVMAGDGTLYISSRHEGSVYAARDLDEDGFAETVDTLATDLNMPNGIALRDGALYVAEVDKVWRYDNVLSRLSESGGGPSLTAADPVLITDSFPSDTHHGWKFIAFGPDDKLYVPVGAPCNICEPGEPYASIMRMNPDGTELETFASGVRNTVGFTWHPETNEMWFTDNGRDMMGDDLPPCELNHAPVAGMHFGYPYFHGGDVVDPEFGEGKSADDYVFPAQNLGPHVAPLGLDFYTATNFPEQYRNQILVAEHGSWNRSNKIGYRVMLATLDGESVTSYEPFATGWLQGETTWGRPVDIELMQDGSVLVSDDWGGRVYRIWHE